MANGYKVFWTENALSELAKTFEYLETNWTKKEIQKLAFTIEKTLFYISINPRLFPCSTKNKEIRKAVVLKHSTLYYRVKKQQIEVLSFFSNRQNPKKLKL